MSAARRRVVLLGLLVMVLAASLLARLAARPTIRAAGEPAPAVAPPPAIAAAPVPEPRSVALAALPEPHCWICPRADGAREPLVYRVDLDLFAPLGSGEANVALWLRQFAFDGPRFGEASRAATAAPRELAAHGVTRVLASDHPLLAEAETWLTHGVCSFYPEVWQPDGWGTPIPDLALATLLGHSWFARALGAGEPDARREDLRRVVRLGRLLLQDDLTVLQDVVGRALVRLGLTGLAREARAAGDVTGFAAAALALGDAEAIALLTAERQTRLSRFETTEGWGPFPPRLRISDADLEKVRRLADSAPERRFRAEAALVLALARLGAEPDQRRVAAAALAELAGDPDPLVATLARSALAAPVERSPWRWLADRV